MFSGSKDPIVALRLALKAANAANISFAIVGLHRRGHRRAQERAGSSEAPTGVFYYLLASLSTTWSIRRTAERVTYAGRTTKSESILILFRSILDLRPELL